MSKSELACKLQGSAVRFVEVTQDLGFIYSSYDFKEYMLKITSFKNIV
jgi:hypothetical protein